MHLRGFNSYCYRNNQQFNIHTLSYSCASPVLPAVHRSLHPNILSQPSPSSQPEFIFCPQSKAPHLPTFQHLSFNASISPEDSDNTLYSSARLSLALRHRRKTQGVGQANSLIPTPAPLLSRCVTCVASGKVLDLSEPQFTHL